MKLYGFLVLLLFCIWLIISHLYPETSWWSIFTSNRSTHTPLIEQISLIKITFIALVFLGLAYPVHRTIQKNK